MTSLASVALPAAYNRVRLSRAPIGRLILLAPRRRSEHGADERRMTSLASVALPAAYNRVRLSRAPIGRLVLLAPRRRSASGSVERMAHCVQAVWRRAKD